ncbi:DUF1446-domain-containing protein [Coleophoma cylindrospora]|uniref:DUF1446-domain-containing protein n=1 Tax=Coleophoma cylindrospora TaxID=1849047 RepID=A0A3D8S8H8_9HELO|nr:DUF1446-domain-containing protein [Coleophoma cylindrospora]
MATTVTPKRPIRVLNISGAPADRRDAMANAAASDEPVDVLVGDWMSELNMPSKSYLLSEGLTPGYEQSFVDSLEPAIENIAKKGIKLAANAGTVGTKALYDIVVEMAKSKNLDLTIAWVEGDVVLEQVQTALKEGTHDFVNFITKQKLKDWPYKPLFAQCYLGGLGIATAFKAGADIVICGRVADASPIIGAAAWWHDWVAEPSKYYDELARSLIAGHLIECSTYCCGGNFTGFKSLDWDTIADMGFPFAEIAHDGDVIITKQKNTGGMVTPETCKEQLLYEIQGTYYYNSDVIAKIDQVEFTQVAKDKVRISGVTGVAPPPFTKVGITAHGGYRAELHYCFVGLDIEEKAKMTEIQMRKSFGEERLKKFTTWEFTINGSVPVNPRNQASCIVDARLVAQSPEEEALSLKNFCRPALDIVMEAYPACTYQRDLRTAEPQPYQEYFVSLIPQSFLKQKVHFSTPGKASIDIKAPEITSSLDAQQPSYPPTNPVDLATFGETVEAPLGYIVHARAGDKGSNCNVGFFVRHEDEWDWLRSFLSTERLIELMGEDYVGQKIDRMEFSKLWAVHFLVHDHLDRGVNANTTYDILGKFLSEYIRCKPAPLPKKFLDRGKI